MKTWFYFDGETGNIEYIGKAESFDAANEIVEKWSVPVVWIFDREDIQKIGKRIIGLLSEIGPESED